MNQKLFRTVLLFSGMVPSIFNICKATQACENAQLNRQAASTKGDVVHNSLVYKSIVHAGSTLSLGRPLIGEPNFWLRIGVRSAGFPTTH